MPSHLSTIGFPVETETDLARLADQVSETATVVLAKAGRYLFWSGAGGAEIWLQMDRGGNLIGLSPHFSGPARIRVGIVARLKRPEETELEGALHAWASPEGSAPEEGCYPFVFDVPDDAVYRDLEIPCIAEAQIAAFAHEVEYFPSDEDFHASQAENEVRFASKMFVPSGLFNDSDDESPPAVAVFTGEVLRSETIVNPISNMPFYWALVETYGGQYDVVIDPVLLGRMPEAGGIVSGSFWLSGRLVDYPRKKRSWIGQLLGGVR